MMFAVFYLTDLRFCKWVQYFLLFELKFQSVPEYMSRIRVAKTLKTDCSKHSKMKLVSSGNELLEALALFSRKALQID